MLKTKLFDMIKMFGMCCPKKPKMSLDYIIKWIEENDAIINELKEWQTIIDSQIGDIEAWKTQVEDDITIRVQQAIEDYNWSTLPDEALSHKIDKVTSATDGNLAVFNTEGNVEDSGITFADICTMEFYNGDETLFRDSSAINSILTAGIYNVSYVCNNDTNHNFYSILFVSNNYGMSPRGTTGYNVIQYLLDNKGYYTRYRQFGDAAHTNPIGDWTDWKNADVVNSVEARIYDPVSSDAVYTALQEKADKVVGAIAGNLASLDENGNLQDSEKKPSDFAEAEHSHKEIRQTNSDDELALVSATANEDGDLWINLALREADEQTKVAKITYNNINNLNRALEEPDTTPNSGSAKLVTSGGVYTAISKKSDKKFCDKVYSRLMEFEKKSSVEYDIAAIYDYGDSRPFLKVNGTDIIYEYDRTSEKITILHNVDYLYELAFVGDVFVIKDLTTGTSIGTARVEEFQTGPNRIKLSGLPLPANPSYIDKNIEIAITHGNY